MGVHRYRRQIYAVFFLYDKIGVEMKYILVLLLSATMLFSADIYTVPFKNKVRDDAYILLRGDIGLKETTGHNDGPHIKKYMDTCRLNYRMQYPYCAAYITWGMFTASSQNKIKTDFPRTALAYDFYKYGKAKGVQTKSVEYRKRDILVWNKRKTTTGHTEMIDSVCRGGNVFVLSANTSNGKSGNEREGNGNYIRKRNLNYDLNRMMLKGVLRLEEK